MTSRNDFENLIFSFATTGRHCNINHNVLFLIKSNVNGKYDVTFVFTKVKCCNFYVKNSFTVIIFPNSRRSKVLRFGDLIWLNIIPASQVLNLCCTWSGASEGPARFAHFAELSASFAVCLYTLLIGVFMIATQPIKCFALVTLTPLILTRSWTWYDITVQYHGLLS